MDISLEVALAAKKTEELIAKRKNSWPLDHILFKTMGSKSAIGDFGEILCGLIQPNDWSWRTSSENDKVHKTLGKCEIKTSRQTSDWYNQIRFNKDWETLVLIEVGLNTIHASYCRKTSKLQQWDAFEINNDYCLKNKRNRIQSEEMFTKLFAGTY